MVLPTAIAAPPRQHHPDHLKFGARAKSYRRIFGRRRFQRCPAGSGFSAIPRERDRRIRFVSIVGETGQSSTGVSVTTGSATADIFAARLEIFDGVGAANAGKMRDALDGSGDCGRPASCAGRTACCVGSVSGADASVFRALRSTSPQIDGFGRFAPLRPCLISTTKGLFWGFMSSDIGDRVRRGQRGPWRFLTSLSTEIRDHGPQTSRF